MMMAASLKARGTSTLRDTDQVVALDRVEIAADAGAGAAGPRRRCMEMIDSFSRRSARDVRPAAVVATHLSAEPSMKTLAMSLMAAIRRGSAALSCAAAACMAVCMTASPASAQSVEAFYGSHELTILIGHPPGGSYDLYAQLAAAHLGRYIPGKPTVIVQSMPGGAGSRAASYLYAKGPKDGSMIALFPETIAYVQLMDPAQGRWDVTKMSYVGSFAPVNTAFMVRKGSRLTAPADLFTGKTNVGCSGRTSQSFQYPATLKAIAGMPLNIICGYDGSSAYTLALLRGEVDLVSKAWNSWRAEDKDNIDNGTFVPLLQAGLKRTPELPNVPLMQEIISDPGARAAAEFISAGAAIGRALIAPPNVPPDRVAALRAAFDQVVVDKDFLAEAQRRSIYIEPAAGTEVQKFSDAIIATPKTIVDRVAKAFDAS
jgi:tripartite-type tricarboxylate transporter receptor subunit TctC